MLGTVEKSPVVDDAVVYPVRDGKPVAESAVHWLETVAVVQMIDAFFRDRADVLVASNNFIYYERGVPSSCLSPDAYVVFGVSKEPRDCYKVWEEDGHVPSAVFELTSPSTRREDLGDKKRKCATIGVKEYFLYDPKAEYLKPPLQGFSLQHGFYTPIIPDMDGRLKSRTLGLEFVLDDNGKVQLFDSKTGKRLPRKEDVEAGLEKEKSARQKVAGKLRREAKARQVAETEFARETEARKLAESEVAREIEARKAAESELARLKSELERLKSAQNK